MSFKSLIVTLGDSVRYIGTLLTDQLSMYSNWKKLQLPKDRKLWCQTDSCQFSLALCMRKIRFAHQRNQIIQNRKWREECEGIAENHSVASSKINHHSPYGEQCWTLGITHFKRREIRKRLYSLCSIHSLERWQCPNDVNSSVYNCSMLIEYASYYW